jgi:TRAP-type C4-dicarboxylate transport system permease small subunit
LTRLLELLLIAAMAVLVLDVLWGVLSRLLAGLGLLARQSSQTEELARFLLIWVGLLGASLAFQQNAHLGLDYVVGKFHPAAQKLLEVSALLLVLLFAVVVLGLGGWDLMRRTFAMQQIAPALGVAKGWVYLAVPLSGAFTALFTVVHIADVLRGQEPHPRPAETEVER